MFEKPSDCVSVGSRDHGDADLLERLIRLFTHEDLVDLTERQVVVLRRLCKLRQRGLRYNELGLVGTLLPLVENRIVHALNEELREPFLKLLNICSLAPLRDRANEEFTERGVTALSSLFRALGKSLVSSDGGIQAATADAVRKIAVGNDPARPDLPQEGGNLNFMPGGCQCDLRPKPRDVNQALLLGCGVVTTAVACLDTVIKSLLESFKNIDEFSFQSSSSLDSDTVKGAKTELSGTEGVNIQRESDEEINQPVGDALAPEADGRGSGCLEEVSSVVEDEYARRVANMATKHKVLISLLQVVRELSTNAASSTAVVEAGAILLLVQVMRMVRGFRDPALSIAVEVMWNCLEHGQNAMTRAPPAKSRTCLIQKARKTNAAFSLSTWDGVSALKDAVESLFVNGFRNKDKELRNDIVIVSSLLAANGRSHPLFRSTGFLLLLLKYATCIETSQVDSAEYLKVKTLKIAGDVVGGCCGRERREVPEVSVLADPRNFAIMMGVDLEFRLLLWSLLTDLCKQDSRNLEMVEASLLMETLLMYMDLVIEEGPSLNAAVRSVSLASMPPVGTYQTASTMVGADSFVTARTEDGAGKSGGDPEAGIDPINPTSPPAFNGRISGGQPAQPLEQHHGIESSTKFFMLGAASACSTKEASSEGRAKTNLSLEPRQLYFPSAVMRLSVASINLLQGQAIASLSVLAPRCSTKFRALGGHMMTLRLLDRLGSRSENQRLVKSATRMLATLVGLPGLKEELGRVDGVRIMLDRFTDAWERGPHGSGVELDGEKNGSISEGEGDGILTDTVIILCRLCEDCPENQESFRKAGGVSITVTAIKAYCQSCRNLGRASSGREAARVGREGKRGESDGPLLSACAVGIGSENLREDNVDSALVHIVECLWCAVVGNRRNEARLLQCEGLDTLLDLLELCPSSMLHQVTGIVADLLRNKHASLYAKAWRSEVNMLCITQLMVRLWVTEEARLGVSRPNGVLRNPWKPLQSHHHGSGCRGRHPEPIKRSGGGQAVNATNRSSSGIDTASNVRFSHTNSGNVDDVTSGIPIDGEEPPPVCNTTTAIPSAERQETVSAHSSILRTLPAYQQGASAGQRSAAYNKKKTPTPDASIPKVVHQLDLRGKIAAVLRMVGVVESATNGLGPSDLKAAYMAISYLNFREGETWQEVASMLEAQKVNPIAADALVLDNMLERAFDHALEVKSKQMALTVEQEERDGETEKALFASILFQRDQEFRQAVIKRNALLPSATKRRLAAKKSTEKITERERLAETAGLENA